MKVLKDGGMLSFGGDALDNPRGVSIIEMKATILRPLDKWTKRRSEDKICAPWKITTYDILPVSIVGV